MFRKNTLFYSVCGLLIIAIFISSVSIYKSDSYHMTTAGYIKWVDFNVTCRAMEKAYSLDLKARQEKVDANWVDMLAYIGAKYGGNFKKYKSKDLQNLYNKLKKGEKLEDLTKNMKNFPYFKEAYECVLGGFVGEFEIETPREENVITPPDKPAEMIKKYGLKAYSPIAYGYSFSHCDDFGNARNFGFRRKHLGNDLMGYIGTPVIAVETGYVEIAAWNRYGGWRIGIRSLDKKRYYYYAHLRKDKPFQSDIKEGKIVKAGDVIGYLGMTGYSNKENVNGIKVPHLHFGMQLIFDESQKEGNNEIWIDVYQIVKFLQNHKSPVVKDANTKEFFRKYRFVDNILDKSHQIKSIHFQ